MPFNHPDLHGLNIPNQTGISRFAPQIGMQQPQQPQGPQGNLFPNPVQQTTGQSMSQPQRGLGNPMLSGQKERRTIWAGFLDWQDKSKTANDPNSRIMRTFNCQVSCHVTQSGKPEVNADKWPKKLIMQLIPKQLVSTFGGAYLKNSRDVMIHFQVNADVLETLNKVMSNGYAGCVHFSNGPTCDIRVMILLYSPEKRSYIGFIPNDQLGLVNAIRLAVTSYKKQVGKQGPQLQGQQLPVPPGGQSTQQQQQQQQQQQPMFGGTVMNPQQQVLGTMGTTVAQGPLIVPTSAGPSGAGMGVGRPGGGKGPRTLSLEAERAQNLLTIQQLQQTLEAAKQKEAQYHKSIGMGPLGMSISKGAVIQDAVLKRKHAECSLPLAKNVKLTQNAALAIDDAFSCLVCQVPMRHPVSTSCCKSLVACRECSTEWSKQANNCLKCQAENPVYTEVLGLHEGICALVACNIFD